MDEMIKQLLKEDTRVSTSVYLREIALLMEEIEMLKEELKELKPDVVIDDKIRLTSDEYSEILENFKKINED